MWHVGKIKLCFILWIMPRIVQIMDQAPKLWRIFSFKNYRGVVKPSCSVCDHSMTFLWIKLLNDIVALLWHCQWNWGHLTRKPYGYFRCPGDKINAVLVWFVFYVAWFDVFLWLFPNKQILELVQSGITIEITAGFILFVWTTSKYRLSVRNKQGLLAGSVSINPNAYGIQFPQAYELWPEESRQTSAQPS